MIQAVSAGAIALAQVYGFDSPGAFLLSHIETLRQSENALANRCGAVLEAAHSGFQIGSETSLVVIGLGRTVLGGGAAPVAGAALLTNPVALTCAAIGAIHYGWNALSEEERSAILDQVSKAFSVGREVVRSLADFVLRTIKALLSQENIAELKRVVSQGASAFGRRIGDITHSISDRSRDLYDRTSSRLGSLTGTLPARLPKLRR